MEAMLHQLPLIVTRVGGVSEILGDSGAGVLLSNSYEDFRLLDVPSLDRLSRENLSPQCRGSSPGHEAVLRREGVLETVGQKRVREGC